jgi:hypothetical protein
MIADIGHRTDRILDAVTVRDPTMGHRGRSDRAAAGFNRLLRVQLDELDSSGQNIEVNWEEGWFDESLHFAGERAAYLGRADQTEVGLGVKEWFEERNSLNVIPMEVGEQSRSHECFDALRLKVLPVISKSSSKIEDDRRFAFGLDDNASGVATDLTSRFTGTGGGASHSVKRNVQHLFTFPLPVRNVSMELNVGESRT